jgi:regulatory protein
MDDLDRCYTAAIRILKFRWNSTAELRRKLRAKGFARETVEPTLTRLSDEHWLDDERFAGQYVRTRQQKRIGGRRIRSELIAAGVDGEIADRVVRENVDSDDERARAVAVSQKRLPILIRRYGPEVARNKLTVYLLKQGYDAALVRSIVRETKIAHD